MMQHQLVEEIPCDVCGTLLVWSDCDACDGNGQRVTTYRNEEYAGFMQWETCGECDCAGGWKSCRHAADERHG